MRLLVIEDEEKTAKYLIKGFYEHGFMADTAQDGESALYQLAHHHYDLILLDILLPKYDGWTVIKEIKSMRPFLPIIFLTACGDVEDKVKGLNLGADDYLIKPFSFCELLARVRSLLRRTTAKQANSLLCVEDLKIDIVKHKATRAGTKLDLTAKEFLLLIFLVQHQGEVLSRTLIAERVWDIHFDCDTNVIDVAIRRLRKKVDDPFDRKLIHTIRGIGYTIE